MNLLKKLLKKKLFLLLILALVIPGGYFSYKKFITKETTTSYITTAAEKGTIIVSVSGTGQVSNSDQIEIKPKVSGDIVSLAVTKGQKVKAGDLIAQIDATEAYKSVRDARINLESAKLSLEKLKQPADALSITQAKNSLASAQESKQDAEISLSKAYEDGYNNVANVFLDLPTIITGLHDILLVNYTGSGQLYLDYYYDAIIKYNDTAGVYKTDAYNKYITAKSSYDQSFTHYKLTNRSSDTESIESIINETYDAVRDLAEAVKSANNLIQLYKDTLRSNNQITISTADTHLASLNSYTGQTNGYLLTLLNSKNDLKTAKDSIVSAQRSITEKTESLAKLESGTDALDLASSQLSVSQKQNALFDAQSKLADYSVRAPIDGIITELNLKKGESASSATAIATLISEQKIAEINLNEIDAAKIKVGQKANLTFDAIENLEITGQVIDIDNIGTVSSGVVSYGIKIALDVQDERIKSGMSLSTNIITDLKQDVLSIPASAVKSQGESKYVEILVDGRPQRKTVTTGISNDTTIEITEGLSEGDEVITQTIGGNNSGNGINANANKSNNDAMRGIMQLNGTGGSPR
jgi:HlyD family secretion protein